MPCAFIRPCPCPCPRHGPRPRPSHTPVSFLQPEPPATLPAPPFWRLGDFLEEDLVPAISSVSGSLDNAKKRAEKGGAFAFAGTKEEKKGRKEKAKGKKCHVIITCKSRARFQFFIFFFLLFFWNPQDRCLEVEKKTVVMLENRNKRKERGREPTVRVSDTAFDHSAGSSYC